MRPVRPDLLSPTRPEAALREPASPDVARLSVLPEGVQPSGFAQTTPRQWLRQGTGVLSGKQGLRRYDACGGGRLPVVMYNVS